MIEFKLWLLWALLLIAQNFAFTFVSRARNSGSIARHAFASVFSNGIWFASQMVIFQKLFKLMTGGYGWKLGVFTAAFYTVFTMTGSLLAHYHALRSEKGKAAVGANKKYAQISIEDWNLVFRWVENQKSSLVPKMVINPVVTYNAVPTPGSCTVYGIPGQGAKL
jgi:hypothetical protein